MKNNAKQKLHVKNRMAIDPYKNISLKWLPEKLFLEFTFGCNQIVQSDLYKKEEVLMHLEDLNHTMNYSIFILC